jgi:hypothetical protein
MPLNRNAKNPKCNVKLRVKATHGILPLAQPFRPLPRLFNRNASANDGGHPYRLHGLQYDDGGWKKREVILLNSSRRQDPRRTGLAKRTC